MLNPTTAMHLPPPSPTNSSASSSDLDTESTGSFFHDRSTTLGTLMGVTFPSLTIRAPSQHREAHAASSTPGAAPGSNIPNLGKKRRKKRRKPAMVVAEQRQRRRWRWWSLCRDREAKPASLGEFLEVERRFGDVALFGSAAEELEGVVMAEQRRDSVGGRVLFADGRVLPPSNVGDGASPEGSLCRFPVSLTGICNGGV